MCGKLLTMSKNYELKKKDPKSLKINPYSVALKLRKKDEVILLVVGHIPWGISGFVSF